jgi:CRISPR type III-B/RAMP module RAMP protein Cmr6
MRAPGPGSAGLGGRTGGFGERRGGPRPAPGGQRRPRDGEARRQALRDEVVTLLTRGVVSAISPGFYFQRCLAIWQDDLRKTVKQKAEAVKPLEGWPDGMEDPVVGDPVLYQALLRRQGEAFRTLSELHGGLQWPLRSLAPFVTGIGQPHPLENGFAFLKPYGVPYLAASGVKGAVRAACAKLWPEDVGTHQARQRLKHYFGSEDKEPRRGDALDHVRGALVFFDLFPVLDGQETGKGWADAFRLDVVNPHYGPYYQGKDVPADWHSPVPSFFLTLRADLEWLLRLVYAPLGEPRPAWRTEIEPPLRAALTSQGFGAKKSWGYGIFHVREGATGLPPSVVIPESEAGIQAGAPASPRRSPLGDALRQFILTLRPSEVKSQLSRIQRDLACCEPEERVGLADLLKSRLAELGLKPKEIGDLMRRVLPPASPEGA